MSSARNWTMRKGLWDIWYFERQTIYGLSPGEVDIASEIGLVFRADVSVDEYQGDIGGIKCEIYY